MFGTVRIPLARGPLSVAFVFVGVATACESGRPPTYAGQVGEILHTNCASCHRPEGPGPMPLLTFDDAAPLAARIAGVTLDGTMPPWLPARDAEPGFRDARVLTDREIAILRRWAEAGAPRGDPARDPLPPTFPEGWTLGQPDVVLTMDEPFALAGSADHDVFRNFVFPVPLQEPRWVRAVEFLPDNPRVVHHATMRIDPGRTSRLAAEVDPLPGYDALVAVSAARPPGGFFLGWTPGLVPTPFPEGMAWRLDPGTDVVADLHLWPSGRPEAVSARVGLYFTDDVPTRVPSLLRLGVQTINIPAGTSDYLVEDSFRLPVAVRVLAVYPHAHFLARTVEAWAEPPGEGPTTLMRIPAWDFNWQDLYYFAEPVELPAGTILRMRYRFDNSVENPANPHSPPRRVLWGLSSTDEMAEFWLQVVTADATDREELERVARQRDVHKQIEGWEFLGIWSPENPDVQMGLAEVALRSGALNEALERYTRAIALRPGMTMAHHGRGLALERMGEVDRAREAHHEALEAHPTNLAALTDLGRLEQSVGNARTARRLLERAVALDSSFVEALNNLASVLLEIGEMDEAERHLQRALAVGPGVPEVHFNLALALVSLGRTEEGLEALRRGLQLDGSRLQPVVTVAWILASASDPAVRDPEVAVELALQLREATGPDPAVSDLAGVALAAMGMFSEAIRFIEEAIASAELRGMEGLLAELRARQALYREGIAYVEPEA